MQNLIISEFKKQNLICENDLIEISNDSIVINSVVKYEVFYNPVKMVVTDSDDTELYNSEFKSINDLFEELSN